MSISTQYTHKTKHADLSLIPVIPVTDVYVSSI